MRTATIDADEMGDEIAPGIFFNGTRVLMHVGRVHAFGFEIRPAPGSEPTGEEFAAKLAELRDRAVRVLPLVVGACDRVAAMIATFPAFVEMGDDGPAEACKVVVQSMLDPYLAIQAAVVYENLRRTNRPGVAPMCACEFARCLRVAGEHALATFPSESFLDAAVDAMIDNEFAAGAVEYLSAVANAPLTATMREAHGAAPPRSPHDAATVAAALRDAERSPDAIDRRAGADRRRRPLA